MLANRSTAFGEVGDGLVRVAVLEAIPDAVLDVPFQHHLGRPVEGGLGGVDLGQKNPSSFPRQEVFFMSYDLPALCRQVRRDILTMTHAAGSGHPGGSLSAVEILVTLYFDQMHLDPAQPEDPNRDRFLLSRATPPRCFTAPWPGGASFDPAPPAHSAAVGLPLQGHPTGKAAGAGLLLRLPGPGVVRRQRPGSGQPGGPGGPTAPTAS